MPWQETMRAYGLALSRFEEALNGPESDLTRDAAIKRFEFTFDLAWKAIQQFLRTQGILCRSPKGCLQEAFAFGLIQDHPLWVRMIEDRNLTVHTYSEVTARRIYRNLPEYVPLYRELHEGLNRYLQDSAS